MPHAPLRSLREPGAVLQALPRSPPQTAPEWRDARDAALAARDRLRALHVREKKHLAALKEQQLEDRWVREVFAALGVVYDVQPALPTDAAARTLAPDYALFASEDDLAAARAESAALRPFGYFRRARAVGDAKRWGADFVSAPKGQRTPRQQLTDYLHLSGVDWGFLTDGRL